MPRPFLPRLAQDRPRRVLRLVAAAFTVAVVGLFAAKSGAISAAVTAAADASPPWMAVCGAAVAVQVTAAGCGVAAAGGGVVSRRRAVAGELAGALCNRLSVGGLGGTAVRARLLASGGMPAARVAAVLAGLAAAAALVQACVTVLATALAGPRLAHPHPVGTLSLAAVLAAAATTAAAASALDVAWRRARRPAWWAQCRNLCQAGLGELATLRRDTHAMVRVVGATAVSLAARVAAFSSACHAVSVNVSLPATALAYLLGAGAAAALPTPGGLGASELTLSAALGVAGAAQTPALAAVLCFRLASYWLPAATGIAALITLQRHGALRRTRLASRADGPREAAHGRP